MVSTIRWLRRTLPFLALPVLTGCLDDGGSGATGPHAGEGVVSGVVKRVKTGAGVANVVVALMQDDRVVATSHTDAGGSFSFTALPEGLYVARLTGFELTGVSLLHTVFDPVEQEVTVSGEPRDLVFAAVGVIPARILGEVYCGGTPQEGASVRVVGAETNLTVITNSEGKYGANDLATGYYAVIPEAVGCEVSPAFHTLYVGPGQAGEADFSD
jgi:hypothetical protein